MVCHPCQVAGNLTEVEYGRSATGEGPMYRESLKGRVSCRECRELMSAGSMTSHLMTQHGRMAETQRIRRTQATGDETRTFRMEFPKKGGPRTCLVEVCPCQAATRTEMRVHFLHRNVLDTVDILEEGNLPHPQCPRCDMMIPRRALNGRKPAT